MDSPEAGTELSAAPTGTSSGVEAYQENHTSPATATSTSRKNS